MPFTINTIIDDNNIEKNIVDDTKPNTINKFNNNLPPGWAPFKDLLGILKGVPAQPSGKCKDVGSRRVCDVSWKVPTTHQCWLSNQSNQKNPKEYDYTCYKKGYSESHSKNSCKPLTIPDSETHAFEPLHGSINKAKDKKLITCNDGYSFNHDLLHQGGFVECREDLVSAGKATANKASNGWYIKDDHLESLCKKETTGKATCEGMTYNPYDKIKTYTLTPEKKSALLEMEKDTLFGKKNIPVGCKWGKRKNEPPACHFRKKVLSTTTNKVSSTTKDVSSTTTTGEAVCVPLYCPKKNVPNSDRDGISPNRSLPGSKGGKDKGHCIGSDGKEIKYSSGQSISNPEDCYCFQHRSCNTCMISANCHWCGSERPSGQQACYSKKTSNPICSTGPKRQKGGGSCVDMVETLKTGTITERIGWSQLPRSQQTITKCETDHVCRNKETTKPIPKSGSSNSLNELKIRYRSYHKTDPTNNEVTCLSYNNNFKAGVHKNRMPTDYCYYKNNLVTKSTDYKDSIGLPFSVKRGGINIDPYQCEAKEAKGNAKCMVKMYGKCVEDPTCQWVPNKFSNHIIQWTKDNQIEFVGKGCRLSDKYDVDDVKDSYVTLKSKNLKVTDTNNCKLRYINRSTRSNNNPYNLTPTLHNHISGYMPGVDPIQCIDGLLFKKPLANGKCNKAETEYPVTIGGDKACLEGTNVFKDTTKPFYCKLTNKPAFLLEERHFKTSSTKDLGQGNIISRQTNCNQSGFTMSPISETTISAPKDIKVKNGECAFSPGASVPKVSQKLCDLLDKTHRITGERSVPIVHWGKYCKDTKNNKKISQKKACEILDNRKWIPTRKDTNGMWVWGCVVNKDLCESKDNKLDKTAMKGCMGKHGNACSKAVKPGEDQCEIKNKNTEDTDLCKHANNRLTAKGDAECIIEVDNTMKGLYNNNTNIKKICEQWSQLDVASSHGFVHHTNGYSPVDMKGINGLCEPGTSRTRLDASKIRNTRNQKNCERDNNVYEKKHTFSNSGYCTDDQISHELDKTLSWTGGNIISDGNNDWSHDCSSSVLSSCRVTCDAKYGGGGNYTCHYNTHANEVCDHIESRFKSGELMDSGEQEALCNHYLSCQYKPDSTDSKKAKCSQLSTSEKGKSLPTGMKGQLEWIGSPCYLLNNEAFHQGILNMPKLDDVFPPLSRMIVLSVLAIIFVFIIYKLKILGMVVGLFKYIIVKFITSIYGGLVVIMRDTIVSIPDIGTGVVSTLGHASKDPTTLVSRHWRGLLVILLVVVMILFSDTIIRNMIDLPHLAKKEVETDIAVITDSYYN